MSHPHPHRRPRRFGAVLATALLGIAVLPGVAHAGAAHKKSPGCDPSSFPTVGSVTRNTALENQFNTYAAQAGPGEWVAGDSTYSAVLPDGRKVWLYSDTFTGPMNPDGSVDPNGRFINNSIIIDDNGTLSTLRGGTASAPDALVKPADPNNWYWANAVQIGGGALQVIYLEFKRTGSGIFDFQWVRNLLVRYDLNDLHVLSITNLPSAVTNVEWNPWLLRVGSYTYIYGVEDQGASKYMRIARVSGTDLRGTWSYWTGTGWSTSETAATRVLANVGNNYSVSVVGGVYTLVTQDTSTIFSNQIVMYFSCSPTGPFTNKTHLYTTPETGQFGTYQNPNVIMYNAHEQSLYRNGNTLVFSYDLNSLEPTDVHNDVGIYRARFFNVTFVVP